MNSKPLTAEHKARLYVLAHQKDSTLAYPIEGMAWKLLHDKAIRAELRKLGYCVIEAEGGFAAKLAKLPPMRRKPCDQSLARLGKYRWRGAWVEQHGPGWSGSACVPGLVTIQGEAGRARLCITGVSGHTFAQ